MMQYRDFCPRCAIKHLSQARALLKERDKGYPHHVWYAIGHLAEAEDEIVERMPEEAGEIRAARVALERNPKDLLDFEALMYMVAHGGMLEEVEDEWNNCNGA